MSRIVIGVACIGGGLQAAVTTIRFNGLYKRSLTLDPGSLESLRMSPQNRRLLQRFVREPGEGRKAVAVGTGVSALCLLTGLILLIL